MAEVEDYIFQYEGQQQEIMLHLHNLLISMNLEAKIRYKIPFYYGKSWICYLNPTKTGTIELAFPRGNELSNIQGLLDSKERKQVFGIELERLVDMPHEALQEIIQEAILLDETIPYSSKRKGK